MGKVRSLVYAVGLSWLCAGSALAIPITFSFTGAVTDDPFGLSSFGAPITGSYTFNSAAVDSIASPANGSFASVGAAFGFTANVDGTTYSVPGTLTVNTANNIVGGDQYGAIALNSLLTLELFFQDASGTALASDALPLLPPAIASFGFRQFRLFTTDDSAQFLGSVNSLTCTAGCSVTPPPSAVPEPSSLLLLVGLVLAGLGCVRARRSTA